jgi:hypothetical protein
MDPIKTRAGKLTFTEVPTRNEVILQIDSGLSQYISVTKKDAQNLIKALERWVNE